MSDQLTMEALGTEVRQRFDAIDTSINERLSDEKLGDILEKSFQRYLATDEGREHVRKMRFGKSDDKLVGSKYARLGMDVSDVEMLFDLTQSAHARGLSDNGPTDELRNTFKAVSKGEYKDTTAIRSEGERYLTDEFKSGRMSAAGYERALRAMDTAESGYGQQLVGAQYSRDLWKGAEAVSRVFGLFRTFEMEHPTIYLPVQANMPTVYYVQESTVANSAAYRTTKTGSSRVQADAKKLLMRQIWSGELEEDSLIPFLPFIREEAARSWSFHLDSLALNGDTTDAATGNINQDDEDPVGDEHFLAFDGIRHAGLVDNTNNRSAMAGALTLTALKSQRQRMLDRTYKHDWSHPNDPSELAYIADPETCDQISFWDEFLTLDKMGAGATILNGQQGKVLTHPLIGSIAMPLTEADGKVSFDTPSNNIKGQLAAVNRRGMAFGWRRQTKVEVERLIGTDQTQMVWSTRLACGRFTPTGAASGIEWVDVVYDIHI